MIDLSTRLSKTIAAGAASILVANFFTFIGMVTPAWQVAEDTDVNRYVQSGLWIYCTQGSQCWYIFSDNLINYYERVDVCRFMLIGDCRKKLLRTPYFFGWHYACLSLVCVALLFGTAAFIVSIWGMYKKDKLRMLTILLDVFVFMQFIFMVIALTVFVVNAEMLESKYLIGVKNTFEKHYGYSFFLCCIALFILSFTCLAAILQTTFVFFAKEAALVTLKQRAEHRKSQYMERPMHYPDTAYRHGDQLRTLNSPSILKTQIPDVQRSVTPVSVAPSYVGQFIPGQYGRNGEFQPVTRHYLSY